MARIATYNRDRTLDLNDALLGSEYSTNRTINIPLDVISNFAKDFMLKDLVDGVGLTVLDGQLIQSNISSSFSTSIYGSVTSTEVVVDAVYMDSLNSIVLGSGINNVFTSAETIVGSGVLFENNTLGRYFFSTIESIDVPNRTIRLVGSIEDERTFGLFGRTGDLSNTITLVGYTGVTITGDLTVTGDIIANEDEVPANSILNNNLADTEPANVFLWTGTESSYQRLVTTGNINASTLYHRRDG